MNSHSLETYQPRSLAALERTRGPPARISVWRNSKPGPLANTIRRVCETNLLLGAPYTISAQAGASD